MQGWLSWRPVWKLFVCWPFRRGPGRLRSSCRTRFTSTWDRYAVTLFGVRLSVLSHSCCCDAWAEGCCKTDPKCSSHDRKVSGHRASQLAAYEAVVLPTAQNVHTDLCLLWKSLSYSNQTIELGRRWADARSGLMNHFLLLVASCAYGHHLAKEVIAPDWRAGGGNVRLSAIFSWRIGSCCSCDITLTHTSYHSIVGDQTHALSDSIILFMSGSKTGTARFDSLSNFVASNVLVARVEHTKVLKTWLIRIYLSVHLICA